MHSILNRALKFCSSSSFNTYKLLQYFSATRSTGTVIVQNYALYITKSNSTSFFKNSQQQEEEEAEQQQQQQQLLNN